MQLWKTRCYSEPELASAKKNYDDVPSGKLGLMLDDAGLAIPHGIGETSGSTGDQRTISKPSYEKLVRWHYKLSSNMGDKPYSNMQGG